ncbi:hypothetical protein CONPUDRAFT_145477, partial [Coniophora puteana RWD-64-598 SS2]
MEIAQYPALRTADADSTEEELNSLRLDGFDVYRSALTPPMTSTFSQPMFVAPDALESFIFDENGTLFVGRMRKVAPQHASQLLHFREADSATFKVPKKGCQIRWRGAVNDTRKILLEKGHFD